MLGNGLRGVVLLLVLQKFTRAEMIASDMIGPRLFFVLFCRKDNVEKY